MPEEDRRSRRRDRTRGRLVDAAREVMASKGPEATTIQDVTDAADVGKGSFYNHFDSKDAIAAAVVEEISRDFAESLDRLFEGLEKDPARIIAGSIRHLLRRGCEDPMLGNFVLRVPEALLVLRRVMGPFERRDIQKGIEAGRFHDQEPEVLSAILEGAIASALGARLVGKLGPEADAEVAFFVLKGLGVPEEEARSITCEPLPPLT